MAEDTGRGGATKTHENVISATPFMVGVFCDECGQPWAEKAPCPHCGQFARPEARIFRRIVHGNRLMPWTWRTGYEFSDADPEHGIDAFNARRKDAGDDDSAGSLVR